MKWLLWRAQGILATSLVAVIDNVPGSLLAEAVAVDLDASCQLPAADGGAPAQLVVGTLDINIGKQALSVCCKLGVHTLPAVTDRVDTCWRT
jgi:hypothetical protein